MQVHYTRRHEKCLPNGGEMRVEVRHDDFPFNPLEGDNTVHIACFEHRRYTLGHEQLDETEMEALRQRLLDGEMEAYLPVYMLDHSGICLNTEPFGCKWDSGLIGWAYITREEAEKLNLSDEPGQRRKALNDIIRATVREYGHYVAGGCWVIDVRRGDNLDSVDCVCFIGDLFDAEKEADTLLETCFKQEEQNQRQIRKYRMEREGNAYRIYALKDIPEHGVKAGDKGGVIQYDGQLSHEGTCWIRKGVSLLGDAQVNEDALVEGNVTLSHSECVAGNGHVSKQWHAVGITAFTPDPVQVCVYPNKHTLLATVNKYTDTTTQFKHKGSDAVVTALIVAAEKLLEEMSR